MSKAINKYMEQGTRVQQGTKKNWEEEAMIENLQDMEKLHKYRHYLQQLDKGSLDIPGFLKEISKQQLKNLLIISEMSNDEKVKVNIAQDLLDRAGYGKIAKGVVAHSHMDANTTKRELVNMVMSAARTAGIKVKDDTRSVEDEEDDNIIDVSPGK